MLVLTSSIGFAQDYNEEVDLFQAYYGMQKKQVVELIVKVDDASSESFWALYEEYETKRKEIGKKRFAILDKYVENYFELEGETLNTLLNDNMKVHTDYNKLMNTYTKKISKTIGAKQASQFYQLEAYLMSLVRVELMNTMPMIGELEKR